MAKGDWQSISRNFVVTRTPIQVASYAQKFFLCLNSVSKDRRQSSIHDITSVELEDAPITSQMNAPPTDSGNSSQQPSEPP